jgi:hypothetical protein
MIHGMEDDEEQGAPPPSQAQPQAQTQAKATKAKYPCLRCKKNVAKTSKSVRCGTCQLWVHAECENISSELYNILAHPERFGGSVSWTCDCCLASNAEIRQVVKAYTEKIKEVEARITGTEEGLKDLGKKVEKMDEKLNKRDENVDRKIQKGDREVFEEMREREVRRMNVVLYRVPELDDERATGSERIEWDKRQCSKIFHAIDLRLKEDDIKFCRRVGERGEDNRPLLVGLFSEADKDRVLRYARKLESTKHKEVAICQDLTRRQREEEADLKKEADKRNEHLSEEDKSKNLKWTVVGARGEKRLIKTTVREFHSNRQEWPRGGGRGMRSRGTGALRGREGRTSEDPRYRREEPRAAATAAEAAATVRDTRRRMRSEDSEESDAMSPPRKR